ncbi:MAG: hypothetical protein ACR2NH_01975 [Solirubrobacteraceae bacterium]
MAATKGRARATWAQQRFLVVLGLPTLALALGATTISSYVPVLLRDFTGPMVSGALLATEGAFAGQPHPHECRDEGREPAIASGQALQYPPRHPRCP